MCAYSSLLDYINIYATELNEVCNSVMGLQRRFGVR